MICAIILAAGRSQRMGTQKLLLPLAGKPVITRIVDELQQVPTLQLQVVVGRNGNGIQEALRGRRVSLLRNPDAAGDMLGVADNMGRALATIPAEARATGDATIKALVEGAELTEREMLRALEKHGVKKIDPKGERFDPNFHQAMFEVPDPSVPNGTVAQVVQVGYSIGSRVLRPAMVGITKGGPKQNNAKPAAPATN